MLFTILVMRSFHILYKSIGHKTCVSHICQLMWQEQAKSICWSCLHQAGRGPASTPMSLRRRLRNVNLHLQLLLHLPNLLHLQLLHIPNLLHPRLNPAEASKDDKWGNCICEEEVMDRCFVFSLLIWAECIVLQNKNIFI